MKMEKKQLENFREQVKGHVFYKDRPKLRILIMQLFKCIDRHEKTIAMLRRKIGQQTKSERPSHE